MRKKTQKKAIIGVSLLSTALSGFFLKKMGKKLCKSSRLRAKHKKNWKKAIVWSAMSGMVHGVLNLFIKEGQRMLFKKK